MKLFSCSYCGTTLVAEPVGGTVELKTTEEAIERVERGTQQVASELALRRLEEELAEVEKENELSDWLISISNNAGAEIKKSWKLNRETEWRFKSAKIREARNGAFGATLLLLLASLIFASPAATFAVAIVGGLLCGVRILQLKKGPNLLPSAEEQKSWESQPLTDRTDINQRANEIREKMARHRKIVEG